MKNIIWLWSVVIFILLFSWVMVGQNPPPVNPFGNAITAASGAPLGIFVDSNGQVNIGPSGSLGLFEASQGVNWIGSNTTEIAGAFKYKAAGPAALVQFNVGGILLRTAQTGTAGAPMTAVTAVSIANNAPVNSLAIGSSGGISFSQLKAATGTRFLCVDTAGNVTASATACSGT
jgi:hypothetical protein